MIFLASRSAVVLVDLHLVHGGEVGVGGVGTLAVGYLLDRAAVGEEMQGLIGLHVEGGVVVEALVENRVGDCGGVELLLEPSLRGDGEDLFRLSGARAEGEAVEDLLRALCWSEGDECLFWCVCGGFRLGGGFFLGVEGRGEQERDQGQSELTHGTPLPGYRPGLGGQVALAGWARGYPPHCPAINPLLLTVYAVPMSVK